MNKQEFERLTSTSYGCHKFKSLANAINSNNNSTKTKVVILGDDGLFWSVTLATAKKLMDAGYELAE